MFSELLIAFGIVTICVVIHVVVMITLAEWLLRQQEERKLHGGLRQVALLLILVFTTIVVLHLTESTIWAVFYQVRGLFGDFETALYFSLVSYASIGYGDVVLPQKWRLLGAVEGISGVLLCGLSTAFLFGIVNRIFKLRNPAAPNEGA